VSLKVAEKAHSSLGASVAKRWMNCPGSVAATAELPNIDSPHAQLGTAAHALGELALRRNVDPEMWLGLTVEGAEVDEDMVEAVRVYTEYCRALMAKPGVQYWIEQRFSLAELQPPAPMFGTSDFIAYDPATQTLHVVDYKHGQGVKVEVEDNPQLMYYGLGALLSVAKELVVDTVELTIVQPRAPHARGVVRSVNIDYLVIIEFAAELIAMARRTMDPKAPRVAGDHCRFCPASGTCPALQAHATAVAQVEFDALPLDVPPEPSALPVQVLSEVLEKLPILEEWIKAVKAHAYRELERGNEVPGYKLVAKRATRRWADEEQAKQWLDAQGLTLAEIVKGELKSVAQIEKLVGKGLLPDELVDKKSSGWNMARTDDPRAAITPHAGDDFAALPSATSDN
jgi:hypothetical protein